MANRNRRLHVVQAMAAKDITLKIIISTLLKIICADILKSLVL